MASSGKVIIGSGQGQAKWKNKEWEACPYTPNEAYKQLPDYRKYVDGFAAHNSLSSPHSFFQVRIIKQKPSILYTKTKNWWDDPMWMDRVFWVFAKPIYQRMEGTSYQYYVLEPKECVRVYQGAASLGMNIPMSLNAWIVPCECCDQAWNETSAGVSDHLHYRPEVVKSQEQIDAEAALNEHVQRILAESVPIGMDGIDAEGRNWNVDKDTKH